MQQPSDWKREFASLFVLIAANLVPIAGVVLWRWQVRDLIFLYWIETVVICLFFVLRIACASMDPGAQQAESDKVVREPGAPREVQVGAGAGAVFLLVFLGAFCYGLGFFLVAFFHPPNQPLVGIWDLVAGLLGERGAYAAVLAMIASHAYAFWRNDPFGRGEYSDAQKLANLTQPFKRIAVTQVLIVGGGFALLAFPGDQVVPMVVLVAVKTGMELFLLCISPAVPAKQR